MNRYKFRAWHKSQKRMFEVYSLGQQFANEDSMKGIVFHKLEDIVVMQFVGLQDKNGVDVYEGDIVKCYDVIREVRFDNAFWHLSPTHENKLGGFGTNTESGFKPLYRYTKESIEIVGNVYQQGDIKL